MSGSVYNKAIIENHTLLCNRIISLISSILNFNKENVSSLSGRSMQATLTQRLIFTARKRSLGKGNIFTPFCHSVHTGGLPQCMLGYPPGTRHTTPLGPDTPPPGTMCPPQDHAPPGTMHPPQNYAPPWDHAPPDYAPPRDQGDTVNARAARILLECNLVFSTCISTNVFKEFFQMIG